MLIASSRKHIMWYKEEIEKLLPEVARDKVATYPGLMTGASYVESDSNYDRTLALRGGGRLHPVYL
jgi:hypothetical protein